MSGCGRAWGARKLVPRSGSPMAPSEIIRVKDRLVLTSEIGNLCLESSGHQALSLCGGRVALVESRGFGHLL